MNTSDRAPELDLDALFPFPLDKFQHRAIAALDANKSVVVCAPTGSGKTIVGEYAIHRALAHGRRVFYTTPLKALSNQKLRDFREQFGASVVGLITGDILVNINAPIVIMTTEVFRNMLYDTPIGQVGTSVEDVESVILDECHYLSDRQRGTVWEESIIYCPPHIQLLALSATIGNPEQLTDWINQVHGPTELIDSNFRPVPLRFYFVNLQGIFPLLDPKRKKLNPLLRKKKSHRRGRQRRLNSEECPQIIDVVRHLQARDMLPAIYLIFSRRGCDQAATQLGDLQLVNQEEAEQLQEYITQFLQMHGEAVRPEQWEPLTRGIAVHHAGVLPAGKELVETLFEMGLIKVVFATATLAAGINMPARTTIFSSLSKRSDNGHRLLYPSEFLQIAGRAGRRGMDEMGHVVTLQTPFEGAKEAGYLATAQAESLRSWFTPSYGMVLNLLQTHSIEEVEALLERSFAEYLAQRKMAPEQQAIAQKNTELAKLDVELAPINIDQFAHYDKLKERLKEESRLLKILQQQAEEVRIDAMTSQVHYTSPGNILYLKGKHVSVATPLPALLHSKARARRQSFFLICLGADNRWYVVTSADVVAIDSQSLSLTPEEFRQLVVPPSQLLIKPGRCCRGDQVSGEIATQLENNFDQAFVPAPEVVEQQRRLLAVQEQLDNHPLKKWGNPGSLNKMHQRRLNLKAEIHQHQKKFQQQQSRQSYYWQDFLNLVEVLQDFDALDGFQPLPLGKTAAVIRGDNELWLALALMSGQLEYLEPQQLAAVICALITETPRPDSWSNYLPSSEVRAVLSQLKETRRKLFQVQRRHDVMIPVWLERDLVGLVEHWALGSQYSVSWNQLCEETSLDEGDLVRMLRRTVDVLWQIPQIPDLPPQLKSSAHQAIEQMRRFPV